MKTCTALSAVQLLLSKVEESDDVLLRSSCDVSSRSSCELSADMLIELSADEFFEMSADVFFKMSADVFCKLLDSFPASIFSSSLINSSKTYFHKKNKKEHAINLHFNLQNI